MKAIETHPIEIGFVLCGHCQNLLDDPRNTKKRNVFLFSDDRFVLAYSADPDAMSPHLVKLYGLSTSVIRVRHIWRQCWIDNIPYLTLFTYLSNNYIPKI